MEEFIQFKRVDQVAHISLNRPKVFNSFNRPMALRLQEILDQCASDPEVRAIYLTGIGKAFCAGQDLQEITAEDGPSLTKIITEHYNPIVMRIRQIEKPIVCAVNGVAAGAGRESRGPQGAPVPALCHVAFSGRFARYRRTSRGAGSHQGTGSPG